MNDRFLERQLAAQAQAVEIWGMFPTCCVCGGRIHSGLAAAVSAYRMNRVVHRAGCPPMSPGSTLSV